MPVAAASMQSVTQSRHTPQDGQKLPPLQPRLRAHASCFMLVCMWDNVYSLTMRRCVCVCLSVCVCIKVCGARLPAHLVQRRDHAEGLVPLCVNAAVIVIQTRAGVRGYVAPVPHPLHSQRTHALPADTHTEGERCRTPPTDRPTVTVPIREQVARTVAARGLVCRCRACACVCVCVCTWVGVGVGVGGGAGRTSQGHAPGRRCAQPSQSET
jgi:hypothetical protein